MSRPPLLRHHYRHDRYRHYHRDDGIAYGEPARVAEEGGEDRHREDAEGRGAAGEGGGDDQEGYGRPELYPGVRLRQHRVHAQDRAGEGGVGGEDGADGDGDGEGAICVVPEGIRYLQAHEELGGVRRVQPYRSDIEGVRPVSPCPRVAGRGDGDHAGVVALVEVPCHRRGAVGEVGEGGDEGGAGPRRPPCEGGGRAAGGGHLHVGYGYGDGGGGAAQRYRLRVGVGEVDYLQLVLHGLEVGAEAALGVRVAAGYHEVLRHARLADVYLGAHAEVLGEVHDVELVRQLVDGVVQVHDVHG